MQLAQRLRELPCAVRLVISGTPIQNDLGEMHALLDFCAEGLLGDVRHFKTAYERPITAGQDRDATARAREIGAAVAADLRRRIAPFFLRREKRDVFPTGATPAAAAPGAPAAGAVGGGGASASSSAAAAAAGGTAAPALTARKHDLVVWLRLKPLQLHVYRAFLHSDAVKAALNESRSPLAALSVLKKICDHPALLSRRAADLVVSGGARWVCKTKKGGGGGGGRRASGGGGDDEESASSGSSCSEGEEATPAAAASKRGGGLVDDEAEEDGGADVGADWALSAGIEGTLLEELTQRGADASCKTLFVMALLEELQAGGHRTLVFSQSRVMLDILAAAAGARSTPFCRIDGRLSAEERQQQARPRAPALLPPAAACRLAAATRAACWQAPFLARSGAGTLSLLSPTPSQLRRWPPSRRRAPTSHSSC